MKKVAILTLRLNNNYGGLLQAYALNSYIRQLGYDAYTLDLKEEITTPSLKRRILTFGWRFIKRLRGDNSVYYIDIQKQKRVFNTRGKAQESFIKKYIPTVSTTLPIKEDFHQQYCFDAYVVGSDQVWRNAFVSDIKSYFLNSVPNHTIKISYAASFGIDQFDVDKNTKAECAVLLNKFNAISVREKEAVSICKEMTTIDTEWLIDPTLLINKEQYENLLVDYKSHNKNNILLVYILDMSRQNQDMVNLLASKLRFTPVFVGKLNKDEFPSVESWLSGFRDADFVITDSFHGSVFSLIFNKPFLSIANHDRGLSRFSSLLDMFSLTDRLISNIADIEQYSKEELMSSIDFDLVNNIISQEQEKSEQFLLSNLK